MFNQFTTAFEFLTKEFGFELISKEKNSSYIGEYLVIYHNTTSNIQLEFSADETWFHCVIRRSINGRLASYSDHANCIGFEDLALLESNNNNYNHFDYVVGGKGLVAVLKNTAALLKRNQTTLTTKAWIDIAYIKRLREEELFRKFGVRPAETSRPTFFEEIREIANNILTIKGYALVMDSDEQPPYSNHSRPQRLIYAKETVTVSICQQDWRDATSTYYLTINNDSYFEVDLFTNNNAIQEMTEYLMAAG